MFKRAREIFHQHWKIILGLTILSGMFSGSAQFDNLQDRPGLIISLTLGGWVITTLISNYLTRYVIAAAQDPEADFSRVVLNHLSWRQAWQILWKASVASLIVILPLTILVLIGLGLTILLALSLDSGILFWLLAFIPFLVLTIGLVPFGGSIDYFIAQDETMPLGDLIKRVWRFTTRYYWTLLKVTLIAGLQILVGILLLGIGLLYFAPVANVYTTINWLALDQAEQAWQTH